MPGATIVDVGQTKGELYAGQPSTAWGEETEISVRCVQTGGQSAKHWYDLWRDYARYVGADGFGRLNDGEPWVWDNSRPAWPYPSNVVEIVYGSKHEDPEDVWALLTNIEDESEAPYVYRLTVSFAPLAFLDDYDSRSDLLNDLAKPTVQL